MYKCLNCGSEVDTLETRIIKHYEVDTRQDETESVCPVCGSGDLEEVTLCKGCGEHYITSTEDYCKECYLDVSRMVLELSEKKKISFGEAVDLVLAYYERLG